MTVHTFTVNKATICSGNTATLSTSDNSYTYTWSPSSSLSSSTGTTVIASPSVTTVYSVTASNTVCPSITITDSVIVKLSPTIGVFSPTVCSATSATIVATGAVTYTWTPLTNLSNGVTNDTVYVNNPTTNATYSVYGTAANGCRDSAISNVVISNHLGILSGSPLQFCYGNQIGLSAIGASTYTWSTNSPANLDFGADTSWHVQSSVAHVGTYTIAIYGESHSGTFCNGRDTVYLTVNPTPTITAVPNAAPAICSGDSATLVATSGGNIPVSYSWVPNNVIHTLNDSSIKAAPLVTTIFTSTGTYTNTGCFSTATFTVNVTPRPSFSINSPSVCIGSSDSLKVVPTTSLTGAQNYTWTPSSTLTSNTVTMGATAMVTPTVQTNYSVTGINIANGITCTSSATSTVSILSLPTLTVAPTSLGLCNGIPDTLIAKGASTYTWSPLTTPTTGSMVTTTKTVTVNTVFNYTVTGTGSNGCQNSSVATVSINVTPYINATASTPSLCLGGTATLTAVPTNTTITSSTYTWTAPVNGGLTPSTGTVVTITPTGTVTGFGGLNYTVTTMNGFCPHDTVVRIRVRTPPVLNPGPDTSVCGAGTLVLYSHPQGFGGFGNTYTWTPSGAATQNYTLTLTNTNSVTVNSYTVQATSNAGCVSLPGVVTVTVNPQPVANASVTANNICKGQSIDLLSNTVSGANYLWNGPNTYTSSTQNPIIANASAVNSGNYQLTITLGACKAQQTVSVTVNTPPTLIMAQNTVTACYNTINTFSVSGANSYTWSPASAFTTPNSGTVTTTISSNSTYSVIGENVPGCPSAVSTVSVNILQVNPGITPSPETGNHPLSVVFTNNTTNTIPSAITSYSWNYGNDTTYHTNMANDPATHTTYTTAGVYTVTLLASATVGQLTCTQPATVTIVVTDIYSIVIPNVFTPNSDGINDLYMVKSTGVISMDMIIYDRWGLKMFESSNINGAWDGKNLGGKEVPEDTYFYVIKVTTNTNTSENYKGNITLLR